MEFNKDKTINASVICNKYVLDDQSTLSRSDDGAVSASSTNTSNVKDLDVG